jgi:hypothetical protein
VGWRGEEEGGWEGPMCMRHHAQLYPCARGKATPAARGGKMAYIRFLFRFHYRREAPSLVCSPVSCHVCKLSSAAVSCACFEHPNAPPRTIMPEEVNALSFSETHPESWQALLPPIQCHALSIIVPPNLLLHPLLQAAPGAAKLSFHTSISSRSLLVPRRVGNMGR